MGLFGKVKDFGANLATGGAYGAQKGINNSSAYMNAMRDQVKGRRLGLVDQMEAPQMSGSYAARIRALNEDAKAGPLSQDKYFQGDRSNLVQKARQEVAGIHNRQGASGVRGGFSNIGSTQDAYDRLSGQLAQLGQQSAERKSQAAQEAADMEQGFLDRETDFANEQIRLKDAIEAGDLETAVSIITNAQNAKAQASTSGFQTLGQMGGMALGGYLSRPGKK